MTLKKQLSYIPVPFDDSIQQFLKNARAAHRDAVPQAVRKPGRHSEEKEVLKAVKAILLDGVGSSAKWSQGFWVTKIQEKTCISSRTIHKHLKNILSRNLFPTHMIPASFVKSLTSDQQRSHWLAVAWSEEIRDSMRPGDVRYSVSYQKVIDRYQRLLAKHKASQSS